MTTGTSLTIRVARTVGGRWLESHKAWTGSEEISTQLAGAHPSRDAAIAAAVDAVRDWITSLLKRKPVQGRARAYVREITRSLNTIDKRLTAERARAAKKAHDSVVAAGGTLGEALNAGVAALAAT